MSQRRVPLFVVLGAFVLAHLHFLLLPGLFNTWTAQTSDQLMVLRNAWPRFRPAYSPLVAHVDLTNSSIRTLATPYLNRGHFAGVIDNLAAMQVAVQLWDFIFAAPLEPVHDAAMIAATRRAGNVYYGMALDLAPRPETPAGGRSIDGLRPWQPLVAGDLREIPVGAAPFSTFGDLARAAAGLGSLSVRFDPDGVLRRVPLLIRRGDGFVPVLSLRAACDFLGIAPERIELAPGKHLLLRDARLPGRAAPFDIRIPIDDHGNLIVNYAGPWERMDHYNMADILRASDDRDEMEMWAEEMRGKLVVVSDLTTGSADIGTIPGDKAFPLGGVHANIINSILTGAFLREMPIVGMLGIEALLMLLVWFLAIRSSSLSFCAGAAALSLAYIGAGAACFLLAGLLLNMVRPVLMLFFALVGILVYRYIAAEREKLEGLRQRDKIRTTFGRYLSNEVVEELLTAPEGLNMGGETRRVTFLVADLRGFTALSATLPPERVIEILNRFLGRMVDVVGRHQGTVDEIQGDGLLVFFGAPLSRKEDEARAVACAVDMQSALNLLNEDQKQKGQPALGMGIGIHTGTVVVGNIGSEKRAKYGAVGSAINIAFRIESHTVAGQILVSEKTFAVVQDTVRAGRTLDVRFKGLRDPMRLYEIIGIGDRAVGAPGQSDATMVDLAAPVPVACHLLEDKQVSRESTAGELTATGSEGGRINLHAPVPVHANLLIRCRLGTEPAEIYAKVTAADEADKDSGRFTVRVNYTWMPEDARSRLEAMAGDGLPEEDT